MLELNYSTLEIIRILGFVFPSSGFRFSDYSDLAAPRPVAKLPMRIDVLAQVHREMLHAS